MAVSLSVEWLGSVPYADGLSLQREAVAARRAGETGDRLLLLEHPAVVTLGRSGKRENLLLSVEQLAARGVELHEASRGGDVTWHGPGQLVGYAVLDLAARGQADVGAYLRRLEVGLIDALSGLGVAGRRIEGWTGVFAAPRPGEAAGALPRKIASIGVGLHSWVSDHGFALNVAPDLAGFEAIIPCGLHGVEMTSVARELGDSAPRDLAPRAREAVTAAFLGIWG